LPERQKGETVQYDRGLTRRDGEIGRLVRRRLAVTMAVAVRTTGAAGLGAGAERLIDDGLDRARATAALRAASEAAIELLGVAGEVLRTLDDTADIVVAKHVAGTDDHLKRQAHR
jgi:hypothetical protein